MLGFGPLPLLYRDDITRFSHDQFACVGVNVTGDQYVTDICNTSYRLVIVVFKGTWQ